MSTSSAIDIGSEPLQRPANLPKAAMPPPSAPGAPTPDGSRNPMFELLVQSETDVTGLLAYSLYKQNKRDWLISFQSQHGRPPDETETEAFILGERIARRTATYRLLAEEMLRSGETAKAGRREAALQALAQPAANDAGRPAAKLVGPKLAWRQIGWLLLGLVAMAIVFRAAGAWLFR